MACDSLPWLCCDSEMIALGHSRGTTDVGTGTLSRIDPDDGTPIWTVDFGADTAGRPRIAYGVDVDSQGNVYAYWRPAFTTANDGHALGTIGTTQGIHKYDSDGNLLASLNLPNVNGSFVTPAGSLVTANVNIRVDPNDDTKIYCGCDWDVNGYWLYRLDDSLTIQWGAGPTEVSAFVFGRCCGVTVGNDGKVYASNTNGGVFQFLDDGTFVDDDTTFIRADGMAIDPVTGRLKITQDETDDAIAVAGYAAFPTMQFAKTRFDFPEPEVLGTWNVSSTFNFRGSSCIATGANNVFASIIPMQYARSGGGNGQASYLVTDASGNPVSSGAWPDTITGLPVYGITRNASTGSVYVTGVAGKSGKIDPLTNTISWTNQTYSSPAAGDERGWSIAARNITGGGMMMGMMALRSAAPEESEDIGGFAHLMASIDGPAAADGLLLHNMGGGEWMDEGGVLIFREDLATIGEESAPVTILSRRPFLAIATVGPNEIYVTEEV